jgi:GAF domain-containing protein
VAAPTQQELEHAAAAHFALQPIARLLARDAPPEEVYATVVERLGMMLGAQITALVHFGADDVATVFAEWTDGADHVHAGETYALEGDNVSTRVLRTRQPARIDDYREARGPLVDRLLGLGIRSVVGAPVLVAGEVWGVLVVSSNADEPPPPETEERIATFAELVAVDIASAEARRELTASRARSEVGEALRELRELAHGLHPTVLNEHGLAAALASLAEASPLAVEVEVDVTRRVEPSREVAAYYVVSEGLANAVKHAGASHAVVRAFDDGASLGVEVCDDGAGGASPDGSGLRGLADRVAALGGTFEVESPPGGGTTLRARMPLPAA